MAKTSDEIYEEQLTDLAQARTAIVNKLKASTSGESTHHCASGLRDIIEAELQILRVRTPIKKGD